MTLSGNGVAVGLEVFVGSVVAIAVGIGVLVKVAVFVGWIGVAIGADVLFTGRLVTVGATVDLLAQAVSIKAKTTRDNAKFTLR